MSGTSPEPASGRRVARRAGAAARWKEEEGDADCSNGPVPPHTDLQRVTLGAGVSAGTVRFRKAGGRGGRQPAEGTPAALDHYARRAPGADSAGQRVRVCV